MTMENNLETFLTAVLATLGLVVLHYAINPDSTASVSSNTNFSEVSIQTSLLTLP